MNTEEPAIWHGGITSCEICKTNLIFLPSFADCAISQRPYQWGLVCTRCVEVKGLRIGPGHGQLYTNHKRKAESDAMGFSGQ